MGGEFSYLRFLHRYSSEEVARTNGPWTIKRNHATQRRGGFSQPSSVIEPFGRGKPAPTLLYHPTRLSWPRRVPPIVVPGARTPRIAPRPSGEAPSCHWSKPPLRPMIEVSATCRPRPTLIPAAREETSTHVGDGRCRSRIRATTSDCSDVSEVGIITAKRCA